MEIAELIALAAVRSGKTRKELAEEMGATGQKLSKLSAGEHKPNASEIIFLASQAKLPPLKTLAEIEGELHPEFAAIWKKVAKASAGITSL
ncbi:MAG: hypothetical protein U1E12_03380 [Hydrogenophaga sp.]|uniref:hypothetical protein n=1 Tax=Hydrogenophaga sp. TaxID=1904254 RepID=UPI002AB8E48D|nr:hypothetical protein [Hydrogenophaga sp.]MDZ4100701.1 hypothetical protein [Hydrogenophaga sp.]